ncbi:ferric reductase-like transmembrane domain-containing protein [Hoeflea sp. AS60]|uniref:ferric reductase-like transmembrane domain-containing protein n=1 Tax=Hoeflea sp. AS60 TaxID=3135780 RepID=UPI00316F56DB
MKGSSRAHAALIWAVVVTAIAVPIAAAAMSPLLQWRGAVYIAAGFAGIVAMALLLLQPLLVAGALPGLSGRSGRLVHRWAGGLLVVTVVVHVAALWVTSPPDVIDALLFASPTPFSFWGVVAMWAVFASALLAALRWRLPLRPQTWRLAHTGLAAVIVVGSVVHAMLIEGTMETISKFVLCALVTVATLKVIVGLNIRIRRSR